MSGNFRKYFRFAVIPVCFCISACSLFDIVREDANVSLVTERNFAQCDSLGTVQAVADTARDDEARLEAEVRAELLASAKQQAFLIGGDTVREAGPLSAGVQTFQVYRCLAEKQREDPRVIGLEVEAPVEQADTTP